LKSSSSSERQLPFGGTTPQLDVSTAAKGVTLSQLESHLWEAANILRGPVDAADFKTYVFPLLFFKRISDVRDEEYQAALKESDGDEEYALFPQNYRFQIPEDCHWEDVRAVATNVGQALQKAMRGIEKANPETLYGIFCQRVMRIVRPLDHLPVVLAIRTLSV
jgi:type I restriction-modification system DNA methylase subunit